MGFFDRFKKKEEPKVAPKEQPLRLQYSDGIVANVHFNGRCDVEGKSLHSAHVEYVDKDGSFTSRQLLLEPILANDGSSQDVTEQYYRWMSTKDETHESIIRYNAVKGFFKKQEITEEKIGSNYIGSVAMKDKGQYYRYFDKTFRARYNELFRAQSQQEMAYRQSVHEQKEADIRAEMETKLAQGKRNEALYQKMQQGVATKEEINEYYSNVNYKYAKDKIYDKPEI